MIQSAVHAMWILTTLVGVIAAAHFFALLKARHLKRQVEKTLKEFSEQFDKRVREAMKVSSRYALVLIGILTLVVLSNLGFDSE